jgi:hypothetical protein
MKRTILAFVAGLAAWVILASVLNRGLRALLAGYTAAEVQMHFTLGMMAARLAIAVVSSLVAGGVVAAVAPSSTRVPWILGVILLAAFIPAHVTLWKNFPIWYHVIFLVTLVPLLVLGTRLEGWCRPSRAAVEPS